MAARPCALISAPTRGLAASGPCATLLGFFERATRIDDLTRATRALLENYVKQDLDLASRIAEFGPILRLPPEQGFKAVRARFLRLLLFL